MNEIELAARLQDSADRLRKDGQHELADLMDEADEELGKALLLLDGVENDAAQAFVERHTCRPEDAPSTLRKGKLTERQRDVLIQALTGGTDAVCRNYYCAADGHHSWGELQSLCAAGLMYRGRLVPGQTYRYFHSTAAGCRAVGLRVPPENFAEVMRAAPM